MQLFLKPSNIYYSQADISNHFFKDGRHGSKLIGETLDDICEGRCSIHDIPTIRVIVRNGKYVTSDNRRLWVFRQLERLGRCTEVPVIVKRFIRAEKETSTNGGQSVRVRGSPGGYWHSKRSSGTTATRSVSSSHYLFPSSTSYQSQSSGNVSGRSSGNSSPAFSSHSSWWESYPQPTRRSTPYIVHEEPRKPENDSWCTIL